MYVITHNPTSQHFLPAEAYTSKMSVTYECTNPSAIWTEKQLFTLSLCSMLFRLYHTDLTSHLLYTHYTYIHIPGCYLTKGVAKTY